MSNKVLKGYVQGFDHGEWYTHQDQNANQMDMFTFQDGKAVDQNVYERIEMSPKTWGGEWGLNMHSRNL